MYFIKDKKIHWESKRKCPQKVTAVLRPLQARIRGQLVVYRTDSEQEVQNRRLSPDILQLLLQLPPTTPSTTPIYNSEILLLLLPITADDPPTTTTTTTAVTEVVFAFRAKNFEKYHFKNC